MKYLKVLLVAVITVITFGSAKAQHVVVKARIGAPVHRHYHRRVVVEHRPIHHRYYRRHHRGHYRRY